MFFYSIYAPDYKRLFVVDIVSTNKITYIFGLAPQFRFCVLVGIENMLCSVVFGQPIPELAAVGEIIQLVLGARV